MRNKKPKKLIPLADNVGRIIRPGSFHNENWDRLAQEILAETQSKQLPEEPKNLRPRYNRNLISQYNYFRRNIHEPRRVFYPCCELDASPVKGFPNSEVVLVDNDENLIEPMRREGITQFIHQDVLAYNPKTPFDLVIILNPGLPSRDLTRHLRKGGYALADNWNDNAQELLDDKRFEGIGTIWRDKRGFYLRGDFFMLEPNQFPTYLYVFKRR